MKNRIIAAALALLLSIGLAYAQVTTNPVVTGSFNPASPGPIGAGTAAAITGTVITGTTSMATPSITINSGTALTAYSETTCTPVLAGAGWTIIGIEAHTCRETRIGRTVIVSVGIIAGTSTANTGAGNAYVTGLTNTPNATVGSTVTCSDTANVANLGVGVVPAGVARFYVPTWSARASVICTAIYQM